MTTELTMLLWTALLLLGLVVAQALVGVRAQGLIPLAGPRDGLPAPTGFHARMLRVVDNHREGLTIFAPIVLVAALAGAETPGTALGAQVFFYSRVAHAVVYIAGVPLVRPLIFVAGLLGLGMIVRPLLGLG